MSPLLLHKRRKRRDRSLRTLGRSLPPPPPPPPPPPGPLLLVSARYKAWSWVELTFDRPVDVAGFVAAQVIVDDAADTGVQFEAVAAATLPDDPATVRLDLLDLQGATGAGVRLTATAFTGIKAADDGGTWDGATALELPFP